MLLFLLLPLLFHHSYSSTAAILVDGVSPWPNPIVHVGQTVIFKHKYEGYQLYIFQNQKAFNLCNFTQASLLTNAASNSFTWYPSRPGFYYFAFGKASSKSCNNKYSVKVSQPPSPPPVAPPIPAPISGGGVSSSPAYPWPFRPRDSALSPAPLISSGGAKSPTAMPTVVPADKGGSMPFINSNPAVPLPTGEVDSATIRPLSTSAHRRVAVGFFGVHTTLFCVILLLLL